MITHQIAPYTSKIEKPAGYLPHFNHRRYDDYIPTPSRITRNTPKHIYALWLQRQYKKRGDYVVHRNTPYPYPEDQYLRIVQMQEVHHLLQFDGEDRPLAMEVVNREGTRFWACAEDYTYFSEPRSPESRFDLPPE